MSFENQNTGLDHSCMDIESYVNGYRFQVFDLSDINLLILLLTGQRIDDLKYWESEVDRKLDEIKTEIDNLNAFKTRVQKALEATREPLHIAQQCLANR